MSRANTEFQVREPGAWAHFDDEVASLPVLLEQFVAHRSSLIADLMAGDEQRFHRVNGTQAIDLVLGGGGSVRGPNVAVNAIPQLRREGEQEAWGCRHGWCQLAVNGETVMVIKRKE